MTSSVTSKKSTATIQNEELSCYFCDQVFPTQTELYNHFEENHSENFSEISKVVSGSVNQTSRKRKYEESSLVSDDTENHGESRPQFNCLYCEEKVSKKSDLLKHMTDKHVQSFDHLVSSIVKSNNPEDALSSANCTSHDDVSEFTDNISVVSSAATGVNSSTLSHQSAEPVGCFFCATKLADRSQLTLHIERNHQQTFEQIQEFISESDNSFNESRGSIGASKQGLPCAICNNIFKSKLTLKKHLKLYAGRCAVIAPKKRTLPQISVNFGIVPESERDCLFCDETFPNTKGLKEHMMEQHIAECHDVNVGVDDGSGSNSPTELKPDEADALHCEYCDRLFRDKIDHVKHLEQDHKKEFEEMRRSLNGYQRYFRVSHKAPGAWEEDKWRNAALLEAFLRQQKPDQEPINDEVATVLRGNQNLTKILKVRQSHPYKKLLATYLAKPITKEDVANIPRRKERLCNTCHQNFFNTRALKEHEALKHGMSEKVVKVKWPPSKLTRMAKLDAPFFMKGLDFPATDEVVKDLGQTKKSIYYMRTEERYLHFLRLEMERLGCTDNLDAFNCKVCGMLMRNNKARVLHVANLHQ